MHLFLTINDIHMETPINFSSIASSIQDEGDIQFYQIDTFYQMRYLAWHAEIMDKASVHICVYDNKGLVYFDSTDPKYAQNYYMSESHISNVSGRTLTMRISAGKKLHVKNVSMPVDINGDRIGASLTVLVSSGSNYNYKEACIFLSGWKFRN